MLKPTISVICPVHNDSPWLPRMIDSLEQQFYSERIEIILIDCGSTECEARYLDQRLELDLPYTVLHTRNIGYGAACNLGAVVGKGDFLFFINADAWFDPHCLCHLIQEARRPKAGIVCSRFCNYYDDTVQSRPRAGFDIFNQPCGHGRIFSQAGFAFMPRKAFEAIGKFDPANFMYGEEEDMSWRVWACGYEVRYSDHAIIHHRASQAEYRATNQSRFFIARNILLRICKNSSSFLLFTLFTTSLLIWAEALIAGVTNGWRSCKAIGIDPYISLWRLRQHIWEWRKFSHRVHGDWWMMRFFRLGFGRMEDLQKVWRMGIPKLT